jgi:hypothetical protein
MPLVQVAPEQQSFCVTQGYFPPPLLHLQTLSEQYWLQQLDPPLEHAAPTAEQLPPELLVEPLVDVAAPEVAFPEPDELVPLPEPEPAPLPESTTVSHTPPVQSAGLQQSLCETHG